MVESVEALIGSIGFEVRTHQSAEDFLRDFDDDRPGCLVLDVRLRGMSGLELQEELTQRNICLPVIIVTGYGDVPMAVRALRNGAETFVEKPYNPQRFLERVRQAVDRNVRERQVCARLDEVMQRMSQLTRREREVMELVALGYPNKIIAGKLGTSPKTVETHRAKVMGKMGASSVAQLVRMVILLETHCGHDGDPALVLPAYA